MYISPGTTAQTYRHNMDIEHSVFLCKEHLKILYFLTCKSITCDVFLHFSRTLILWLIDLMFVMELENFNSNRTKRVESL